jgi:hypothetical protein
LTGTKRMFGRYAVRAIAMEVAREFVVFVTRRRGQARTAKCCACSRATMPPSMICTRLSDNLYGGYSASRRRRLLEHPDHNVGQMALQCGFGQEERIRVTFQRNPGVTPSEYRKRFAAFQPGSAIFNWVINCVPTCAIIYVILEQGWRLVHVVEACGHGVFL